MLDCGCGTGHAILRFGLSHENFTTMIGIDHSRGMLDAARRNLGDRQAGHVRLIQTEVIEWLTESQEPEFDLITVIGFLHHLSEPQVAQTLKLVAQRVKPQGHILIAEPVVDGDRSEPALIRWWNRRSLARYADYSTPAQEPDERPLPRELIHDAFAQAGLRICAHASSWEIFNHTARPGWTERCLIGFLYRCGGPGIVNAWRLQPDPARGVSDRESNQK